MDIVQYLHCRKRRPHHSQKATTIWLPFTTA